MDLRQLATFVHVAELGSFTRAARVLQVAQPALSRQVRALEIELRQNLFARTGRGVTVTEAGQRLLAHGRGILQQVERAQQDLEDHRGAPVGHVALGLPPSVSRLVTAPLVEAFRERFPKATLTVVEGLSAYVLEWLVLGRVDLAVVYQAPPDPAVELQPVAREILHLVGPRPARRAPLIGPPATLAELTTLDLVIPSRPHSLRMLLETALATAGLKPRIAAEIESVPAMLELVERSSQKAPLHSLLSLTALIGREPAHQARPVVLDGRRRPLTAQVSLATSAQRPRGALIEQAATLLRERMLVHWTDKGEPR
ncbi:MAG: LysR family transcriptional regulator [Rubrivivax sp.]|nr:LysR family transcriptional regulator [Rubrivivax sp.]